ncbi:MAG: helix-hairpin-helix domain-containing protein [Mucinivorans sp.]
MRAESSVLIFLVLLLVVMGAKRLWVQASVSDEQWVGLSARADSVLAVRPLGAGSYPWRAYNRRQTFRRYVVELNTADSVALCGVYGIGPIFAHRILVRRVQLGGFYALEQLLEIRGIDKEVLARIGKSFLIDSTRIKKININFAPLNVLSAHPYITPSMARRIERERMKGGIFSSTRDLTTRDILLPQEALRVAPYLSW